MWTPGRRNRHNCWCCGRFIWAANDRYTCPWDEVRWSRETPPYKTVYERCKLVPDIVYGWRLAEEIPDVKASPVV